MTGGAYGVRSTLLDYESTQPRPSSSSSPPMVDQTFDTFRFFTTFLHPREMHSYTS